MGTERMNCCGALTRVYSDEMHRKHNPGCVWLTARKRSIAAAQATGSTHWTARKEAAEAASEVWRSDMHDLLEAFDLACRYASPPDVVIENLEAARKKAVEALG